MAWAEAVSARPGACAEKAALREAMREAEGVQKGLEAQTDQAQSIAKNAVDEVARLNGLLALCSASTTTRKLAAHYQKQPTSTYRSGSPRFGRGVTLAAHGVPAGTNHVLSAEHPRMPCPGSHHSNRDAKGKYWSMGCSTTTSFHMPVVPPPMFSTPSTPVQIKKGR